MQTDGKTTAHDGLDDYIRVGSPGLLIIVGALTLILVATLVWGFFGKIPVTYSATGCMYDMEAAAQTEEPANPSSSDHGDGRIVVCFIDASEYDADAIARVSRDVTIEMPDHSTFRGKVDLVSDHPLSRDEALLFVEDSAWIAERCVTSDYSWGFKILSDEDVSNHWFQTPQVTFVMDEVPPISFLTR